MLEVKKKTGESFEALLRRFSKKTIQSGKLLQAKKIRYFQKPSSSRALKSSALRKMKLSNQRDYMKRIGKLDETQERRGRYRR